MIHQQVFCKFCHASLQRVYLTRHWTKHTMTTVPLLMCPCCKEIEVTQKQLGYWFGKREGNSPNL